MPPAMTIARALGAGRVLIGAVLLIAPDLLTRGWVGSPGASPAGRALARGLGARDMAIGAGVAVAGSSAGARPWLVAGAAADAADMVASGAASGIPTGGRVGVGLLAGGSAALGVALIRALD